MPSLRGPAPLQAPSRKAAFGDSQWLPLNATPCGPVSDPKKKPLPEELPRPDARMCFEWRPQVSIPCSPSSMQPIPVNPVPGDPECCERWPQFAAPCGPISRCPTHIAPTHQQPPQKHRTRRRSTRQLGIPPIPWSSSMRAIPRQECPSTLAHASDQPVLSQVPHSQGTAEPMLRPLLEWPHVPLHGPAYLP